MEPILNYSHNLRIIQFALRLYRPYSKMLRNCLHNAQTWEGALNVKQPRLGAKTSPE